MGSADEGIPRGTGRHRHAMTLLLLMAVGLMGLPLTRSPGAVLRAQDAPSAAERSRALQASADRVASHWDRGNAAWLAGLLSLRGIGFHTATEGQASLDPRKAVAALQDLFDRRSSVACNVVRVALASGASDRGSAELAWDARAPGTSEVIRQTVFLGFNWTEAGWRIYEIRILP